MARLARMGFCTNPTCPCQTRTVVCCEFEGAGGGVWCLRCGWNAASHPPLSARDDAPT